MSTLNSGPYQYNRFSAIDELYERERQYYTHQLAEKKAKPDFLDVDGDGDKKESFKKGVSDKKKGEGGDDKKDGKKDLPAFLQKKKDMKEGKCSAGCDCEDCKKDKKKGMNEWIENLVQDGYDLSKYTMEQMEEMYDQALEEETQEVTIEEAICQYLMDNGFANNPVSAEVVYNNMSEGWRDDVVNQLHEASCSSKKKAKKY